MMRKELARYVELKRSLGFKFRCQHILLKGFVAFAARRGDRYVKSARVLEWAVLAPSPAQRRSRLLTVRRFALAMHAENACHQIPASDAFGNNGFRRRTPFIYSAKEIARLIKAASGLEPAAKKHIATAARNTPSIANKRVSPHVLRHYLPFLTMSRTMYAA